MKSSSSDSSNSADDYDLTSAILPSDNIEHLIAGLKSHEDYSLHDLPSRPPRSATSSEGQKLQDVVADTLDTVVEELYDMTARDMRDPKMPAKTDTPNYTEDPIKRTDLRSSNIEAFRHEQPIAPRR